MPETSSTVSQATLRQVEVQSKPLEFYTLYNRLKATQPELADWLRQRVIAFYPDDLASREQAARLALELFAALDTQSAIDSLQKLF